MYESSIGIDSSDLRLSMLDVEGIFDGSVDRGRISMDQMALITYQDGRYTFSMTPSGIRISTKSDEILPSELREAVLSIVRQIDELRAENEIKIDEFDFQTEFELTRTSGDELSNRLSDESLVNQIIEVRPSEIRMRILYEVSPLRYSLNIQPARSDDENRNLRITMFGMIDVDKGSSVEDGFNHHSAFVNHVEGTKERIDRALA